MRQFGLEQNSDGSFTFFTRGVDRIAENTDHRMGNFLDFVDELIGDEDFSKNPFDGADDLWTAFQDNLESYVNNPSNAGSAKKETPQIDRPDWNNIKAILMGEKPISELGCE